jgi:hypothetical protein
MSMFHNPFNSKFVADITNFLNEHRDDIKIDPCLDEKAQEAARYIDSEMILEERRTVMRELFNEAVGECGCKGTNHEATDFAKAVDKYVEEGKKLPPAFLKNIKKKKDAAKKGDDAKKEEVEEESFETTRDDSLTEKRDYDPTYWSKKGKYQQELDDLHKQLVPFMGKAQYRHGEWLRIIGRIYYDVYNNGGWNVQSKMLGYINALSKVPNLPSHWRDTLYTITSRNGSQWDSAAMRFDEVVDAVIRAVRDEHYKIGFGASKPQRTRMNAKEREMLANQTKKESFEVTEAAKKRKPYEEVYYKWFDRVSVDIMDIGKIAKEIQAALDSKADLEKVMPELVKKYRKN